MQGIGDCILLSNFFKALREKEPDANIIFLTYNYTKEIVELCPYIDKIIYVNNIDIDIRNIYKRNENVLLELIPLIKDILSSGFIKLAIYTL